MEIGMFIILLIILVETTILILKSRQHPLITTNQKRRVYVDTSALMDPRLISVAKTGFIGYDIIIPRSVTNELQLLADGKDSEKRIRARAGLDTVRELERVVFFNTTILSDELDHTPVDNRLMELAKANHGLILTNDYNLSKVAATEHIDTLNLNILALTLRNQYLPGEHAKVKIVAAGSNPHQGIAYLRDGTMVVVDHASEKLGQEIDIEVVRLNQTASGTMLFAKLYNPVAKNTPDQSTQQSDLENIQQIQQAQQIQPIQQTQQENVPKNQQKDTSNTQKGSSKLSLERPSLSSASKAASASPKTSTQKRPFPKLPSRQRQAKDKTKKRRR